MLGIFGGVDERDFFARAGEAVELVERGGGGGGGEFGQILFAEESPLRRARVELR